MRELQTVTGRALQNSSKHKKKHRYLEIRFSVLFLLIDLRPPSVFLGTNRKAKLRRTSSGIIDLEFFDGNDTIHRIDCGNNLFRIELLV